MPRYDEMDEVLRHVRERLTGEAARTEEAIPAPQPSRDSGWGNGQYDRIVACAQSLLRDAEQLRELLDAEHIHTLSSAQHEHVLSALNAVMHELWSAEVMLRRARLHE